MTRSNPTDPTDLPPPDLAALARSLVSGEPLTTWRCGLVTDPTTAHVYGLNAGATRTGGAGWLHATCRIVGGSLLLLVGHGRGTEPTWAQVARLDGKQVEWYGLSGSVNPTQDMRQRLVYCLLGSLGYVPARVQSGMTDKGTPHYMSLGASYTDTNLLATDRVLVGATCQREGCHRPLTTPESIREGYGPTCGGRVKPKRTWGNVNLAEAMKARGK